MRRRTFLARTLAAACAACLPVVKTVAAPAIAPASLPEPWCIDLTWLRKGWTREGHDRTQAEVSQLFRELIDQYGDDPPILFVPVDNEGFRLNADQTCRVQTAYTPRFDFYSWAADHRHGQALVGLVTDCAHHVVNLQKRYGRPLVVTELQVHLAQGLQQRMWVWCEYAPYKYQHLFRRIRMPRFTALRGL